MRERSLDDWAALFTCVAGGAGRELLARRCDPEVERQAWTDSYRDRYNHRRRTDGPVLAHVLRARPGVDYSTGSVPGMWEALASGDEDSWRSAIASVCDLNVRNAPLTRGFHLDPIEEWTEQELATLHALTTVALHRCEERLLDRVYAAACWHASEIQPDNATNIPWGCHTFAYASFRSMQTGDTDTALIAAMHVETIVHNAMIGSADTHGQLDHRSAALLIDAAESLDRFSASAR